jgi:hypothetical protein
MVTGRRCRSADHRSIDRLGYQETGPMTKYLKIAAAAIIRYEFEKGYRKQFCEVTGSKRSRVPFHTMLAVLAKNGRIRKNQKKTLQDRYT